MIYYRCFFLDDDGRFVRSEIIEGSADPEALSAAKMLMGQGRHCGVEVWHLARLVGRIDAGLPVAWREAG